MKRAILLGTLAMILGIGVLAFAQGPGMWGGGYGMGPGMMGPGWGGGYGGNYCPNCGAYQGPRGGYGMGPGGGGGYGMGPGMMGPGWGARQGYGLSEECQKYFDESAGMRKDFFNKRFEYFEAMRNPKTTPEIASKLEKEMWDLQQKIYSKAPASCR